MDRQDDAAADNEAEDETIPDSFFDAPGASGQSEDVDSCSSDDGNASEVENDMLESIFGDFPGAAGASSDAAASAAAVGGHEDGEYADAPADKSKVGRKMPATEEGANVMSAAVTSAAAHPPKSNKAMSLAPDVREAGRKARLRLEEERSKRKEIQRIDDDAEGQDLLIRKVPGPTNASTNGDTHKQSKGRSIMLTEPARKKRRRPKKAAAMVKGTTQEDAHSNTIVDLWLPDSSSVNMEGRSNLVRVHGLPYGCKPEEIRRFFKGLNRGKIFVLASYHHTIDGWDCIDTEAAQKLAASKGKKGQRDSRPMVKRYPNHFRVFVQFESTLGADQALKRSGESVSVSNGTVLASKNGTNQGDIDDGGGESNGKDNGKPTKMLKVRAVRVRVRVTPVAKIHSTFLKKRLLAIDGVKGKALHEVVDDVEERLPRYVRRTVWSLAWMKLRPYQAIKPADDEDDESAVVVQEVADAFAILERRKSIARPKDANSYRLLATAYNSLCDLYASIEEQSAVNMALFRHDPTLLEDSVCRLTDAALDLISTEAERVDLTLRWARDELTAEKE
jgi:hypothetical protein